MKKCNRPYLQGRNRDADTENRYVDAAGSDAGNEMSWKTRTDMYTLPCVS